MAQRFLLEGRSLDELTREASALYGPGARIVRAERVLDTGVAGFLGRRHLEVTVEVPDAYAPTTASVAPEVHVLGDRAGILALLDSADRAEDDVNGLAASEHREPATGTPEAPSTESPGLAELLARLGEQRQERGVDTGGPVPTLLSAPGDLVLVVGLEDSARRVLASMAADARARGDVVTVHEGGATEVPDPYDTHPHRRRLVTRWDAAEARALAVGTGATVLTAYGLGSAAAGLPHLEAARALAADQVWVVVDARHKPEDTAPWVQRVTSTLAVDALAVVGAGESRSPHTVNLLHLPIGWLDGQPAPAPVLRPASPAPSPT